eukprot:15327157-Ditylum_brightwellii.AAC.1
MHDERASFLTRIFPNVQFASILGGAEVGIWGVCLPGMKYNSFLYDARVASVQVYSQEEEEEEHSSSSSGGGKEQIGHLVVTNHLRHRFPVRNYDTGDLGSIVPASTICTDMKVLNNVCHAVKNAQWVHCDDYHRSQPPKKNGNEKKKKKQDDDEEDSLVRGVIFSSRAGAGGKNDTNDQFNAYEHTLHASELIKVASSMLVDKNQQYCYSKPKQNKQSETNAKHDTVDDDDDDVKDACEIKFVNGQVIVSFDTSSDENDNGNEHAQLLLQDKIEIRLLVALLPFSSSATTNDKDGIFTALFSLDHRETYIHDLSKNVTQMLREYILETLHDDILASSISVRIAEGEGEEHQNEGECFLKSSTTASNRNKIVSLLDLRGHDISGNTVVLNHYDTKQHSPEEAKNKCNANIITIAKDDHISDEVKNDASKESTSIDMEEIDTPLKEEDAKELHPQYRQQQQQQQQQKQYEKDDINPYTGLHSKSIYLGAHQSTPTPIYSTSLTQTQSIHDELSSHLKSNVPSKLLQRVPPSGTAKGCGIITAEFKGVTTFERVLWRK